MAGIRSTQYPGRWNVPDSNSPQGSAKNRTSPTSNDGSYLDEVWFNDMDSLHQALFIASGVTPNGTPDVGTASQIFDALANNRWSQIGNYSSGTIVTGSDGKQYKSIQDNGRDYTVVDPISAPDRAVWVEFPFERIDGSGGYALIWHDGSIEQYITVSMPSLVSAPQSGSFIVPFTDLNSVRIHSTGNRISSSDDKGFIITESEKVSVNSFRFKMLNFDANDGIEPISGNTQIYIKATGN